MTERPPIENFDEALRTALHDVAAAHDHAPDLAERLLANARAGEPVVVSLAAARRRWVAPLLAAAAVVALAFAAVLIGGAVGHDPTPPATSTNVDTPSPDPALTDFHATDMSFLDADTGWALGDARCPGGSGRDCATLARTTDGGRQWRTVPLPSGLTFTRDAAVCGQNRTGAARCVDRVVFGDTGDGYLYSRHDFYWTSDGGRSWTRETTPAAGAGAEQVVVAGRRAYRLSPYGTCSDDTCDAVVLSAALGDGAHWAVQDIATSTGFVGLATSSLSVARGEPYLSAGATGKGPGAGVFGTGDGYLDLSLAAPCGSGTAAADPFAGATAALDGSIVVRCVGRAGGGASLRVAAAGATALSGRRSLPASDGATVLARSARRLVVTFPSADGTSTLYASTDGGRTFRRRTPATSLGDGIAPQLLPSGAIYGTDSGGTELLISTDDGRSFTASPIR